MKLVHDVPGSRLTLAGEPKRIHWILVALEAAFLLPFATLPLGALVAFWRMEDPLYHWVAAGLGALLVVGGVALAVRGWRASYKPSRIDVNRDAGEIRISTTAAMGGGTRDSIVPLARLRAVSVRRVAGTGGKTGEIVLELRTRREGEDDALESRTLSFAVEHLDKNEEVADLAFRIAGTAGLPFLRVVRNDARDVEIELQREPQPGFNQVPLTLGAANYAQDVVAPAAPTVVAQETVAAFEPGPFKSDHRVDTWTPGSLVLFRKPWAPARFGCLPFTLLVCLGPAAFFGLSIPELVPRLAVSFMATIFGLIIGGVAMVVVWDAFPRSTRVDWGERKITLKDIRRTTEIPFEALRAIELKAVHHISKGKNSTTHSYVCEVRALLRQGGAGVEESQELVSTERMIDNPDAPYRMALPLATELAKALNVERRFVDYD
jgi:hypothetical protein